MSSPTVPGLEITAPCGRTATSRCSPRTRSTCWRGCSASSGRVAWSCSRPAGCATPSWRPARCPTSLAETKDVRESDWQVAPPAPGLLDRRAEITGPTDWMMVVNVLNSGAKVAIGGMAAFIPSRRDPEVNDKALAAVRADKKREADDGFDGSWVAHPDLVPVAMEVFDVRLGDSPNQIGRTRDEVHVTGAELLDAKATPGEVTEAGLRNNVSVGIQYLESWLRGGGAVAIFNLMEDAATAEISRSQVWQWVHNGVSTAEGSAITADYVRRVEDEELDKIRETVGDELYGKGRYAEARELFEQVALADEFEEFLTLPAYERLG